MPVSGGRVVGGGGAAHEVRGLLEVKCSLPMTDLELLEVKCILPMTNLELLEVKCSLPITCRIVPGNACRSLNSDDPCYPDQFWKIHVISMTNVSPKPPMRTLPYMSKRQQYQIC